MSVRPWLRISAYNTWTDFVKIPCWKLTTLFDYSECQLTMRFFKYGRKFTFPYATSTTEQILVTWRVCVRLYWNILFPAPHHYRAQFTQTHAYPPFQCILQRVCNNSKFVLLCGSVVNAFSKKSMSHVTILGARRVTWRKFQNWRPTNIKSHSTEFGRPGDLAPGICASLIWLKYESCSSYLLLFV